MTEESKAYKELQDMHGQPIDEIDYDKLHKMQKFKNVYDSMQG